MVVLRAIFWIAVAVILIPRDPYLGFEQMQQTASTRACSTNDCLLSAASPAELRDGLMIRLHQVKEDLAAKEARIASISK